MSTAIYVDIILALPVYELFTYRLPSELKDKVSRGTCVSVPFGKNSTYNGIVYSIRTEKPDLSNIKEVSGIIGQNRLVSEDQLRLWKWISEYYLCTMGEVMNAAIPSALISGKQNKKPGVKTESLLILSDGLRDVDIHNILDSLKRAPAQLKLATIFLDLTEYDENTDKKSISKKLLLERSGATASLLSRLVEKGLLKKIERPISYFKEESPETRDLMSLSPEQNKAFDSIIEGFSSRGTVLLHGVTSSGKTEIYIHLIDRFLKNGKKVLYLLPEIALTTQIINRLRSYFGNKVGVYHSGLNENEKAEVYNRINGTSPLNEYDILLGVRSSIFLPLKDTGLIIIDEEHDSSYKQYDPAPRYNARDTAIMQARFSDAKVILGSATPSVESMYNAEKEKYAYAYLGTRYGNINLPEIVLSDSKEAYRKKAMISHFTPAMVDAIDDALEKGNQIVLFRNRRGFAHFIICADCGWSPVCPNCSVNYTYHKNSGRLYCHYCGSSESLPSRCGNCSSTNIRMKGFGTEKVEDEISVLFPDARIARMDYDSTRRRGAMEDIILNLEKGNTDILIGTQMVSKGLDIENLTVVGILNIDAMMFYPDFRAHEKCFQLAAQVSGRAGRRTTRGKVIIQTSDPYHPVMKQVLNNDYSGMYRDQLEEREEFFYPPFSRLIRIFLKHKNKEKVHAAANMMAGYLRQVFATRVLGPEFPYHSRIQNMYIMSILLKIDKKQSYKYTGELIRRSTENIKKHKEYASLRIYPDVDPR